MHLPILVVVLEAFVDLLDIVLFPLLPDALLLFEYPGHPNCVDFLLKVPDTLFSMLGQATAGERLTFKLDDIILLPASHEARIDIERADVQLRIVGIDEVRAAVLEALP